MILLRNMAAQMTSVYVPPRKKDGSLPDVPSYGDFPVYGMASYGGYNGLFLHECFSPGISTPEEMRLNGENKIHSDILGLGLKLACVVGNVCVLKCHATNIDGAALAIGPYNIQNTTEKQRKFTRRIIKTALEDGLQLAARNGHTEVVKYLTSAPVREAVGLDIHANYNGAFHEACEHKRTTAAKALVEAGILNHHKPLNGLLMRHLMKLLDAFGASVFNSLPLITLR